MSYGGSLSVSCGSGTVLIPFSDRDWRLLIDALRCKPELAQFPSMLGFGREPELSVDRAEMLRAARAALEVLRFDAGLLSYDYLVDIPAHGAIPRIRGECNIHGLRIKAAPYSLYARHGQCWLERWESDDHGLGRSVELIDLRRETTLMLDGNVEVRIRRKWRGEPPWQQGLTQLVALLEDCTDEQVEVKIPLR